MGHQASKVLDERVRALGEDYETQIGEAIARITERFEGKIESLLEEFGEPLVAVTLQHHRVTLAPSGTLYSVFKPMVSASDQMARCDVGEEL